MALIKNLEEQEVAKEAKPTKTKGSKVKTKPVKQGGSKGGLMFVVLAIIIIIAVVVAYNYKKLTDLTNGVQSKEMKDQIETIKNDNQALRDRLESLEKENIESKNVVADLFDKSRELPKTVDSKDWLVYNNEKLLFSVKLPVYWEVVKTIDNTVETPAAAPATASAKVTTSKTDKAAVTTPIAPQIQQTVYLQPKDDVKFSVAMTIKNDYLNLSTLSVAQKFDVFKGLKLIDQRDYSFGKMLYYIDLDKDNNEIPTILILTDKAIYRATFNVMNKTLENYMKFRVDFENIASTFEVITKAETPAAAAVTPTNK